MAQDDKVANLIRRARANRNPGGGNSNSSGARTSENMGTANSSPVSSAAHTESPNKRQRVETPTGDGTTRPPTAPPTSGGSGASPAGNPPAPSNRQAENMEAAHYLNNLHLSVSGLLPAEIKAGYAGLAPAALIRHIKNWTLASASVLKYLESEVVPSCSQNELAAAKEKVASLEKAKAAAVKKAREDLNASKAQVAEAARVATERETQLVALRAELAAAVTRAEGAEKALAEKETLLADLKVDLAGIQEALQKERSDKEELEGALVDGADLSWRSAIAQFRLAHPTEDLSWMHADATVQDGQLLLEEDGQVRSLPFPGRGL